MTTTPPPPATPPDAETLNAAVARLQAELEVAEDAEVKAVFLHELGHILEQLGDDGAAVKYFKEAYNAAPGFREPLEALVALLHRRRSFKNLGKLLDALASSASTVDEVSRARVEYAGFLLETQGDAEGAKSSLREAVSENADDLAAWLELEILAAKEGDRAARIEALQERAARAEPATWRALLMLDLAEQLAAAGDPDRAADTCRAAAALEGAARFRAQAVLAALARKGRDDKLLAEALEAQTDMVSAALEDPATGDAEGVPRYARTAGFLADALLRAAEAKRRLGDNAGAQKLLERAAAKLPGDLGMAAARLMQADASGDIEQGAAVAKKLLETIQEGPEAAALWLRVYEGARRGGDKEGSVGALAAALKADPASLAARTLHLDVLGESDGAAMAAALEAAAEQVGSEAAKARLRLRAAWEWALSARDTTMAKATLTKAEDGGVPASVVARLSRLLAALTNDAGWYDEATRCVLDAGTAEGEQTGLWFELVRGRILRGDGEGASKALDALAQAPGGAWLSRVLGAYAVGLRGEQAASRPAEALDALAQVEPEPALARGFALAAAWRAQLAGDKIGATRRLQEALKADAGDVVAAAYLAELLRGDGDAEGAAAVLEAAAGAADEEGLKASLALEAGLLLWRAGKRERSLEPFRAARSWASAAAGPLLTWAVRGVAPDALVERRQALDMAVEAGQSRPVASLERFGIEVVAGEASDARAALETLENESQGALRLAAALARVAWPPVHTERGQLDEALSLLATEGDVGAALASAERVRLARDVDQSMPDYVSQASTWAEVESSLPAGLEWLAASIATEDHEGETSAHRLLARHLEGPARSAEEAAAATVQWLTSGESVPDLLPSTNPAAQLMNLELAPPGCDPRRRSGALKNLGDTLGSEASVDAVALAGWSDLAAGETSAALRAFQMVLERRPGDLSSWEGLRTAAIQLADFRAQADATFRIGELCKDDARGALFLEEAGLLWFDQLGDQARGEQALAAAFARDARRSVAFDKLFRRVRDRKEHDRLIELAQRRLQVAEDEAEIVKMYWEQARIFHGRGDYESALQALESVTMFEPDNVGALVLYADIYTKSNQFAEAAEAYARMAANKDAPAQQRLGAGMQAANFYEKRLGDVTSALEVLRGLHKANLSTLPVRERLAQLAIKAEAWADATAMCEKLMIEREKSEGRIEAAFMAMTIWRDRIGDPKGAKNAVVRLLEESPGHGEALDLVIETDFAPAMKAHALGVGKSTILQQLQRGTLDADSVARLVNIASSTDDLGLLQASMGVLVALGSQDAEVAEQQASLDARTAKVPQMVIDPNTLAAIGDPADTGPIIRLFEVLGEIIAEALGPTKDALGVGRKERVDPRSGLPLRNDIAAWVGALGLGEFELYIGGRDPNGVQGVGGEVPAIVVGANIKSPLSPAARQAIAREVFALKRGITVVRSRDDTTVASIAVAACNLVSMRLESPAFAILGDVQRQLDKAMSRKVKKLLPDICQQVVASRPDVRAWARAAQRSLDRMAAIAAGDVSLVLSDVLNVPRGELRRHISGNDRAERLVRFVLAPQYLELRNHLGMGVR